MGCEINLWEQTERRLDEAHIKATDFDFDSYFGVFFITSN